MSKRYTLTIWNRINSFIKEHKLITKRDRVLLAVSGGPDSMAMLHYFDKTKQYDFVVFHLNHSIRKDSDVDENIVKKYCENNSIKFISKKIDVPSIAKKLNDSLEHVARKKRYEYFIRYAKKYKCLLVATAHNLDDHIETVILNLLRGTSLKGLAGIPVKRKLTDSIFVIRPIMCLKKEEILRYLKENKIKYTIDKTNFDTNYTRNWIRYKLIPMIEKRQPSFGLHLIKISNEIRKVLNIIK